MQLKKFSAKSIVSAKVTRSPLPRDSQPQTAPLIGSVLNKISLYFLLILVICLLGAVPSYATFPSIEIALWDSHFAKADRTKPEYLQILELAKQEKFSEALPIVETLIKAHPEKGTPNILKSLLQYELKRYPESFHALQVGKTIQPRHPAIQYHRCQLYRQLGVGVLSERSCEIAAQQHPKQPEAFYEKALTLSALGKMKDANKELEMAASLDATNAAYPFERGMNLAYLNQTPQAIEAFHQTLKLDPKHLDATYQLGFFYAVENKMDQAKKFLNQVYDTRQDHPKVDAARALLEFLETEGPAKLPSKIDPAMYHLSRSQKLYEDKEYGLSLIEIQTAARLAPEHLPSQQVLIGVASLFMRLKIAENATRHLLEIAGDNPKLKGKANQELGDLYILKGNLAEAKKYYEAAVELGDPDSIAKTSLDELPAPDSITPPEWPSEFIISPVEALNKKGEWFAHFGMFNRAVGLYSLALRMDPMNLSSKLNTAAAYFNSEQYNRAIAILEKTLVSHPSHSYLFSHRVLLAKAYAKNGDLAQTTLNLKKAKAINPNGLNALKSDSTFKGIDFEAL